MTVASGSRREKLGDRAVAVASAPWVVLFVLLLPAAAISASNWAFSTGSAALEALVAAVLMAVTLLLLWWWLAGDEIGWLLRFGRFAPTVRASTVTLLAVVNFTSLTGLLQDQGIVGVTPAPAHNEVLGVTFGFYLWQVANTVPLVDLPGNLHWDKPFQFDDGLGGLLLIAFTGFVIFPLIRFARLILARGDVPFEVAVLLALGRHVGADRISVLRHPDDYGRAIVDRQVTIDVMRDVWNHDAAVERLKRLESRPPGYLLVVDAIAEGAREPVESALLEAPFEAELAVWRRDQPTEDLTARLDALEKRMGVKA